MLNIEIQCCGVVLMLLISFFYLRFPKLRVHTKTIFGRLLIVAILCAATDILSVYAIYYEEQFTPFWVKVICKVYLVCLMSLIYSGFIYLCADVFAGKKTFDKVANISGAAFAAAVAGMQFLPIDYVCENNGRTIYSFGLYTTAVYAVFGIIFIAMLTLMQLKRKTIMKRRMTAIRIWLGIWIGAALLQLFNSSLLVVTFAGCVGVLIVFLMIENPELALDKSSGFFHSSVIPQYVNEVLSEKEYYLINTRFNPSDAEFFEKLVMAVKFVGSGEIYLLFKTKRSYEDALLEISGRMDKRGVYVVEDRTVAENGQELLALVKKTRELMRAEKTRRSRGELTNVIVIDNEIKKRLKERAEAKILINEALAEDRIEPFFQPIYSIEKETFYSAEALARIRDKDGGIIPPYRFIPVAEETGSIIEIGKKMYEKTCEFLRSENPDALGLKYIELNLSIVQGEDKRLADFIISKLYAYNIRPDQINLEITESASINGREQLLKNMEKLLERGIEFSLDDFGTGQSNLDYMTMMPVSLVKFDRSMTQSYFVSEKTQCVLRAAVGMIHEMGMKIVIEGIETLEQLEEMKTLGVDYIQGYYFSKPLCKAEFIEFLKKNNKKAAQNNSDSDVDDSKVDEVLENIGSIDDDNDDSDDSEETDESDSGSEAAEFIEAVDDSEAKLEEMLDNINDIDDESNESSESSDGGAAEEQHQEAEKS